MKRFILIRHGKTAGNLEKRYIGVTDEALCEQGIEELRLLVLPPADRLFVSPMLRCRQTAAILYPHRVPVVVPDFRECDFGLFEGKNYQELNGREEYQRWIDSGGELPFPGGECRADFARRCVRAFEQIAESCPDGTHALIVHGGVIMSIMEEYARPAGSYYDFQVDNAQGYLLNEDGSYRKL